MKGCHFEGEFDANLDLHRMNSEWAQYICIFSAMDLWDGWKLNLLLNTLFCISPSFINLMCILVDCLEFTWS